MDMDPSEKEKPQHLYFVYLRINNQESFCVRNLSLSEYLRLIHDDEYTVNYVQTLVTRDTIKNEDANISIISRSKDNVNFESIDIIDLPENRDQDIIFLDDFETLSDSNINADAPTLSTQNSSKMEISIVDLPR